MWIPVQAREPSALAHCLLQEHPSSSRHTRRRPPQSSTRIRGGATPNRHSKWYGSYRQGSIAPFPICQAHDWIGPPAMWLPSRPTATIWTRHALCQGSTLTAIPSPRGSLALRRAVSPIRCVRTEIQPRLLVSSFSFCTVGDRTKKKKRLLVSDGLPTCPIDANW